MLVAVVVSVLDPVEVAVEVAVDVTVASHAPHVPGHCLFKMSPMMRSSQSPTSIDRHSLSSMRPLQYAVVTVDVSLVVAVDVSVDVSVEVTEEVSVDVSVEVAEEVAEEVAVVVWVLDWVTVVATHAMHITGQSSRTAANGRHCDWRPAQSDGSSLPLQSVSHNFKTWFSGRNGYVGNAHVAWHNESYLFSCW